MEAGSHGTDRDVGCRRDRAVVVPAEIPPDDDLPMLGREGVQRPLELGTQLGVGQEIGGADAPFTFLATLAERLFAPSSPGPRAT